MAATSFPNPFFPSGGEGMDLGKPATRRRSVRGSELEMRSKRASFSIDRSCPLTTSSPE
uniref:Uncharacterized protein n=1 Tax=Oryza sativa subsp. japonica TaxID=39947 RepID=Q2QXQ3_ORYSJ|nr:hypothetical protein LOC_Os12g05250 [Oryza sativa Japonica Group]